MMMMMTMRSRAAWTYNHCLAPAIRRASAPAADGVLLPCSARVASGPTVSVAVQRST